MKYAKFAIAGLSLLGIVLGLSAGLQRFGGQGLFTLIMAGVPLVLVAIALGIGTRFGRLFAGLSLAAFLIVGMKTTDAKPLENLMMVAFGGMIAALVVLIRPERARS